MLKFDEQGLRHDLDRLPPRSRLAFAASCAERMVEVYRRFLAQRGQPDRAGDCDHALQYVWSHILRPSEGGTAERLLADIMALIPDQDALGWTPLTAYGEDALSALAYCVSCLKTGDAQDAVWAARRVYEALDSFVTNRDNVAPSEPGAETRILGDPMIQAELKRQARDLDDLGRLGDTLSARFLDDLRQRSAREPAMLID